MAAAQVYLQEVFKLSVDELGMCLAFQVLWSFILNTLFVMKYFFCIMLLNERLYYDEVLC